MKNHENHLSTKLLDSLKAGTSPGEYLDDDPAAFGVRVGVRTGVQFFVVYRVRGTGQRIRWTFAQYPATGLADARKQARTALESAKRGVDPKAETQADHAEKLRQRAAEAAAREAQSAAEGRAKATTVEAVAAEFLRRHVAAKLKPTSQRECRRHIGAITKAWGTRQIADITSADIHALGDELADAGKPYAANRLLATVSKLMNWAAARGGLGVSPIGRLEKPGVETSRDRVLTDVEVRAIWRACDQVCYPFGPFVRMVFATGGQRRTDVACMRWSHIDGVLWTNPDPTKSDNAHMVPLSSLAVEILDAVPRFGGAGEQGDDFVFTTTAGEKAINGFSRLKTRLDKLSGVTGWRLHDIRRTVATRFADLGMLPHIAEAVQNRKSGTLGGVVGIYNRSTYNQPKREALERWGDYLRALTSENVVSLRTRSGA